MFSDQRRAESFRTMHELFPARTITPTGEPWAFDVEECPLPERYTFDGERRSLTDFLVASETTGLLVARHGTILHEAYHQGFDQRSLATSFSLAKPFVAAMVGISIDRGMVASVADPISAYVPELIGSAYDGVTIRDALTMASGVQFDEDYGSGRSDIMSLPVDVYLFRRPVPSLLARLERAGEPGTGHAYASSDTLALSLLVARATGTTLASYLEQTIWGPTGMTGTAAWNTDLQGNELGHAFLNATLRDYARFGRLLLDHGQRDGRQVIPADWIRDSFRPTAALPAPGEDPTSTSTLGFGYSWWTPDDANGDVVAVGIWGQFIYLHPGHGIVIVKTSTDPGFGSRTHETIAAFRAIVEAYAEDPTDCAALP